jgi:multidrug efflux pump subunit AcrA (membrane-fusion protein)
MHQTLSGHPSAGRPPCAVSVFFPPECRISLPENAPPPLVSLSSAQLTSLPLSLTTQGHVISLNQVDIQSQITGTVKRVAFQEGAFVRQGQLLFTLEDSTQQATLHRDQASRSRRNRSWIKRSGIWRVAVR